jgi:predicted aspartyl protease
MISRRRLTASLPALGLLAPALAWGQTPPAGPLVGRFDMVRNRPSTLVEIEGQGPFRFLIDTGANTSLIDPDLAAQLKLERLNDSQLQGATFERTVQMYVSRRVVVAETLRQRGAVVFAAGRPGEDFDGVLPGSMFTGANVEIDFAAGEFRIFPGAPPDRTGFARLPLAASSAGREEARLVVTAHLDGRPVRLVVDTGGTGAVMLNGEYVGRNKLWDRYPKWAPIQVQGLLSDINSRLVRTRSLQVGPTRFDRPLVHLADPFNPPGDANDGILGMDLLRRFTLSIDPFGGALWLKPNGALHEPFRYNRAGFETAFADGRGAVRSVLRGGPGDRAGLKVGDGLPTVEDARDMARFDWFLSEGPGTKLEFDAERAGARLPVKLVLEELL